MPLTRLALCLAVLSAAACQPVPPAPLTVAPATMTVGEAQAALSEIGLDPGPVDGILGRRTRGALIRFQESRGLAATGRIDAATTAALRSAMVAGPAVPRPVRADAAVIAHGAGLAQARRAVARRFQPADFAPVDLNGDGLTDYIVRARRESDHCGMRLCSHMVLLNTGRDFRVVVDNVSAATIEALPGRTRGHRDLRFVGTFRSPEESVVWRWTGRGYSR